MVFVVKALTVFTVIFAFAVFPFTVVNVNIATLLGVFEVSDVQVLSNKAYAIS